MKKDEIYNLKDALVAWIDILGFRKMIQDCKDDNSLLDLLYRHKSAMQEAYYYLNNNIYNRMSDQDSIKSIILSDGISIALEIEGKSQNVINNAFLLFIKLIGDYQLSLIRRGFFVRGAISKGKYHFGIDQNKLDKTDKRYGEQYYLFSPAHVEAYILECNEAQHPRIIIDKKLIKEIKSIMNHKEILVKNTIKTDKDKNYYIHYLHLNEIINFHPNIEDILTTHKSNVIESLEKYEGEFKIYCKYIWVKELHNNFCKEKDLKDYLIE